MKNLRLYVLGLVAAIIVIEIVLFLLPAPSFISDIQSYKTSFLIVSLFSAFYFGSALLFLYGIYDLRPEMRKSYQIITASMAFFGIVNLQYPVLIYAGLIPGVWTTYGGSLLIIIPGVIMHYWGVRHLARTLGVKTGVTSFQLLAFSMIAACGVVFLLPHVKEIPEFWFGIHQISATVNLVLNLFTALILLSIIKIIGPTYKASLRWFTAGVILSTIGFLHVVVAALFGQNNAYTDQGATAAPFIIVALFYFVSGYYFCKIRFFGLDEKQNTSHGIVDAIVTIASLVSYQKDIDELLERMRNITAQLSPGEKLSQMDEKALVVIYLQIEQYLINYEKLKSFTKDSLRARLSVDAIKTIETNTKT
ncbi:MAG TPA: hypothetical protein VLA77_03550 [Candidatus Saccharimonadales bacterium]|nr:hypothetical protein [Candidatus Saccharimonadales bacterium]